MAEAEGGVETDRGEVRAIAYDGDHLLPRAVGALSDELGEEGAADALALEIGVNVNGVFEGEAVGGAGAVGAGVGVSGEAAVKLSDDVREAAGEDGVAAAAISSRVGGSSSKVARLWRTWCE